QKVFGADGSGKPADQWLWTNGEYDVHLLPRDGTRQPLGGDGADRQADREHDGLYPGPATATCAGGRVWRDLCRRRRIGAWIFSWTGVDGGEVCAASVQ